MKPKLFCQRKHYLLLKLKIISLNTKHYFILILNNTNHVFHVILFNSKPVTFKANVFPKCRLNIKKELFLYYYTALL